ncbi:MAG: DNA-binding protein WhiA [Firmicutes bacterium]|nr:DNA-binding protein WhiA [Bacillota bacterium]
MTFSLEVKEDLNRVTPGKVCCRHAEFAAFFLLNGNIHIGEKHKLSLTMESENSATARKMFTLAKDYGLHLDIMVYRREKLRRNPVYLLSAPPQAGVGAFLQDLSILGDGQLWDLRFPGELPQTLLAEDCCKRAYLRGAFLAAGSLADPDGAYHLEIDRLAAAQAELLRQLLAHFGIHAKQAKRKNYQLLYLKDAEQISHFLNVIGSHRSLLQFENIRVEKGVRNRVNRLVNCDKANVNKTVTAGMRQAADIDYIDKTLGVGRLPKPLQTVAELRLENPEAALSDLAALSGLGRSAVNHRLRRLQEIAANIRDFGPEQWRGKD